MSGQSPNRRKHLQFGIRGLFVVFFAVAGVLVVAKSAPLPWSTALFAAAAAWCMCGLVMQVVDLWNMLRTNGCADADVRCGWRIGIVWRLGLLLLFLTYYVVQYLLHNGIFIPIENRLASHLLGGNAYGALLYLLFVLLLTSVPGLVRSSSATRLASRWLATLGLLAAAMWCLLIWSFMTLVYYYVYLATTGIELSEPKVCAIAGTDDNIITRGHEFLSICLLATLLAFVSFALIRQVALRRPHQHGYRVTIWAMLASALAGSASLAVWITTGGLWRLSPAWANAEIALPMLRWLYVFVLSALLATSTAYRLLRQGMGSAAPDEPNWRRHEEAYYHEHRGVMVTLILASLILLFERHLLLSPFYGPPVGLWDELMRFFHGIICLPISYLIAAVLLLAARGLFIGRTSARQHASTPAATMRLPCARFVVVWLALFVTLASAGVALAWLSFAVWLIPWAAF